jgi:hypothetical protein
MRCPLDPIHHRTGKLDSLPKWVIDNFHDKRGLTPFQFTIADLLGARLYSMYSMASLLYDVDPESELVLYHIEELGFMADDADKDEKNKDDGKKVWKCKNKYKHGSPSPLFALELLHRYNAAEADGENLNCYGDVKGGGVSGLQVQPLYRVF